MLRSSWNRIWRIPRGNVSPMKRVNQTRTNEINCLRAAMLYSSNRHVAAPRAFKRALVLIWIVGLNS